jgi:hypothetical protein
MHPRAEASPNRATAAPRVPHGACALDVGPASGDGSRGSGDIRRVRAVFGVGNGLAPGCAGRLGLAGPPSPRVQLPPPASPAPRPRRDMKLRRNDDQDAGGVQRTRVRHVVVAARPGLRGETCSLSRSVVRRSRCSRFFRSRARPPAETKDVVRRRAPVPPGHWGRPRGRKRQSLAVCPIRRCHRVRRDTPQASMPTSEQAVQASHSQRRCQQDGPPTQGNASVRVPRSRCRPPPSRVSR